MKKQTCSICKKRMKRVHNYRIQLIQGLIISNKLVKISLRKRRYLYAHCHHVFYFCI
ncbi:transposase family protein [Paraliobacillus sp. JSM ZJ581]|uniref:transposase family protein n=1 Tax=Paraliobacillus sp. JSM ZJ581 TaxID=3342118 RepID=UPI0035A84948